MPNFVVTNTGKNTLTEAVKMSSKSLFFILFYQKNHVALMEKLLDIMEEDDDVQNVWHNWEE